MIFNWRLRFLLFLKGIRVKNLPLGHQPIEDLVGYPVKTPTGIIWAGKERRT